MMSSTWIAVVLAAAAFTTPTQPSATDQRPQGPAGAMTVEELRRHPVRFMLDIPYAGNDNPRQRLDLYLPEQPATDRLPVIVFLHGGGWMQGDKADGARRLLPFVAAGRYAGVSAGYRLSGEATWPAQIHDAKAAVRWVRANAAEHGLDPEHIAVWGRSAGAHLALMLGATGDVRDLEGDVGGHPGQSSRVSAVVNFFGVTDMQALIGETSDIDRTSPEAPEALLIGGALRENPAKARAASPLTYVTPGDPPVLTLHGTGDRTVPYDQAARLHEALTRARVPSYLITVNKAGHGGFPDEATERTAAFFARVLLGENVTVPTEALNLPPTPPP